MSNSRKSSLQKPERIKAASHDWMAPVDAAAPCGIDLEYDPEFVVLAARMTAKQEAQYGDFVGSPEPVNWSDVDRDCRRLMVRSKDMRLAVLFARCRTRLSGAAGLAEGVGLLAAWLAAFPEQIHPQPGVDADREAALEIRMNALQALTDADGLLADVREIALTKSTATRLQMRDIERAFAQPRPSDALAPESVTRQLEDLRSQQQGTLTGFDEAFASLAAIDAWSREHLGMHAPDLSTLTRLLRHVAQGDARPVRAKAGTVTIDPPGVEQRVEDATRDSPAAREAQTVHADIDMSAGERAGTAAVDRHAALELIRQAREWFEKSEPSSPVPLLLRRAELLVGKRYAEVVKAIPAELLVQWDSEA
ncbi:type VI secretion system protein TssA [Paraburkholderia xenovorans]|nr:type VI secretion system ImpA family N-terminal domain-containing protein [Paraburkholderia xenovorans]NPT37369.1 type VI secretion system protein TssA [Paraburkholderia xenovorans]